MLYRRTAELSIAFLFDENPDVASAGSGGAAVGGARSVPDHAARSNSERAAPSARALATGLWLSGRLRGEGSGAWEWGRPCKLKTQEKDVRRVVELAEVPGI